MKMEINPFKECRELELRFFECPPTLFLLNGLITIFLITTSFFLVRLYYSDEVVFLLSAFITIVMLVITYFVHQGTSKTAYAKKRLQESNDTLREALKKLKEAEKLQQEFTNMMVHDLRSPLNGIRMLSELIVSAKNKMNEKELKESIKLINHNSQSMLSLVNDLLDVAKIESGMFAIKKELNDIIPLVEEIIAYFKPLTENKKIRLNLVAQENIPEFKFDKKAIKQVFENLISNSIKFTPENKLVEVQIFMHQKSVNLDDEAQRHHIKWLLRGGDLKLDNFNESLVIAVTDQGYGITMDNLSRLFNKFEQVGSYDKIEEKGTGLGLVIVKGIVEAHGGEIGVASKEGLGTTFYFNLPLK